MTEQTEQNHGIQNVKEALTLGFSLIGALKVSKENDGKIGVSDLGNLVMVFPHVSPAIDDADKIPAELKDMDEAEAKELLEFASEKLGKTLGEEELVTKINLSLKAAVAVFEAVKAW